MGVNLMNQSSESTKSSSSLRNASYKLPNEFRDLLAGGIAGMLAKTVVAPVDRIKILYQVTSIPFQMRDMPHVISRIIRTEGVTALWRGNGATLLRVFPYAGIQFMVFNRCKSHFTSTHDHAESKSEEEKEYQEKWGLSPVESLIAGSAAGAVSVLFTYPLDLTRAQLAVSKKQRNGKYQFGFLEVLGGNYRNGGMQGLFRGIMPTLLGILPYSGVAFAINEQTKRQIYMVTQREPNTIEKVQCGALSGLVAQSMTYPFEVTRRRMQTIGIVPMSGDVAAVSVLGGAVQTKTAQAAAQTAENHVIASKRPPSMGTIMSQLMKEQGVRGFFKGLTMNWVKGPISFSISFTAFDVLQKEMERKDV